MKWLAVLLSTILFLACTKDLSFNYANYDYCENINIDSSLLYDQLSTLGDQNVLAKVLEDGELAMMWRAWLTQNAKKSIDIQYFIFSEDNIGIIATDFLIKAACRGVKVRIIVDDLMLDSNTDYILSLSQHENISIKIYNPNLNIGKNLGDKLVNVVTDFRGVNQRMHHKIFLVDGDFLITGGRNVADEYFDFDHEYNFRDRDVLLTGKVNEKVNQVFEQYWNSDLSKNIHELVDYSNPEFNYEDILQWINDYAEDEENYWTEVRQKLNSFSSTIDISKHFILLKDAIFVSDIPGKNSGQEGLAGKGETTDSLIAILNEAKKSVHIQTPYLVVTDLSLNLFKAAVERGVEINILTNSLASTDNLEAFSGYHRNRKEILKSGVNIYEYKPDAMVRKKLLKSKLQKNLDYIPTFAIHAKSMVVDDQKTIIGTFNLDPRSANLNTECFVTLDSEHLAKEVLLLMKEELKLQNAWKVTEDFNPDSHAGLKKRLKIIVRRLLPKSIL